MKTKSARIYQDARNLFARENSDPTLVFDEACVAQYQSDLTVTAVPQAVRDGYLGRAEVAFDRAYQANRKPAEMPMGDRLADQNLNRSAKAWKAYLGV